MQQTPDWPPQASAVGLPDGERRNGSTGQIFKVSNGRWERVPMVTIACRVPNGIMIRRSKKGADDGTGDGVQMMAHDGPGIRLNGPSALHTGAGATSRGDLPPGLTEVESEWWDAWLAQNQQNPLITMEQVYLAPEDAENPMT